MGIFDELLGAAGSKNNPLGSLLGDLGDRHGGSALGDLVGQALGGDKAKSAALIAGTLYMVRKLGGFEKVVEIFQQKGLGKLANTWLSQGGNAALPADEVTRVFGKDAVAVVANKAGVPIEQASSAIGQMLPELLNQLSPHGSLIEHHHDLLAQLPDRDA